MGRRIAPLVAALALFSIACPRAPDDARADYRASVATQAARTGRIERTLSTTGTVRATDAAKAVAEAGGKLQLGRDPASGRRLAIGDVVRRGQLLAVIAGEELATNARLQGKRQALESAKADHQRNKKLLDQGLLSANLMSDMDTRLANAQAEYDAALLQQSKGHLTAPIAGVITSILTAPDGEFVATGTSVAEVMSFAEVIVDLDLGASDILAVEVSQPVRVSVPGTDVTVEGLVDRVSPAIDPKTRTFRTEVRVKNDESRLRPGMFVRADLVLEARDGATLVPARSVVSRNGQPSVFVVDAQVAHARQVTLGLVTEELAQILDGVEPGQAVVSSGQETLDEGVSVIVRQ